jgi:hypothetical protein
MIGQETREVERKIVAILRVLSGSPEPLGGRVIARRLGDLGINLGERQVRYHLKLMDERGLTHSVGRRDGRSITPQGTEELKNALVTDRVGSIANRIEVLAYGTSLDPEKRAGDVPINISLFPREKFDQALEMMKGAFRAGLCVSDLVHVAFEGERLGEVTIPQRKVGLATVSSIAMSGVFLKAGIPLDSRFGGILQIRDHKPLRFIELIEYSGCSVDPCQLFIAGKMTSVGKVASRGTGKMLANFRELPAPCRPAAEAIVENLKKVGFGGLVMMGEMSEPICEIPVRLNKVGMILLSGLNPVAAAVEAGIEVTNHAMSGMFDFRKLKRFWDV